MMGTRPQLIVASAFRWESLWRWDLGRNLLLSQAFQWESLWRWDFRLSRSLWLSWSLVTKFSSFTMEFRLSRSLSRTFLFHNGISAITERFHEFFFHTMEFWLSRSLWRTFLFRNGISSFMEPFHELFFHDGISAIKETFHTIKFTECTDWGKTLFIYITKSIYTGPAS
jgi:hypothetical protein